MLRLVIVGMPRGAKRCTLVWAMALPGPGWGLDEEGVMTVPSVSTCLVAFGSRRRKPGSWASADPAAPINARTAHASRNFMAPPISCKRPRSNGDGSAGALQRCRFDSEQRPRKI